MAMATVVESKKGCYRCRCGKTLAEEDYLGAVDVECCAISPTGRHVYVYIYPNGCPSTGSKHS